MEINQRMYWEMRKILQLIWMVVDLNDLLVNLFVKNKGKIKDEFENLSLDNWKNYG